MVAKGRPTFQPLEAKIKHGILGDPGFPGLRKAELADTPRGPIRFDDYGNPIQNIYVRKVERVEGRLQNTVIHTFEKVSQFWNYQPEEYLKNPVYDRNFPPCKHC